MNYTKSRMIDRKQWVFETEPGWAATKRLTESFFNECLAFDNRSKLERHAESIARKRRREEVEEAAFCWETQQTAEAAQAPKAAGAAEDPKSVKAVQAPTADKAVQVAPAPVQKADKAVQVPAPVEKAAVFTAATTVPSVSTATTRVPSASGAPVVSAQPSNGQMVVKGVEESLANMRLIIKALSTKHSRATPQMTSAAADGLNRQLDNIDLVMLALRAHVQ